jgi:hypothetical protein
VRPVKFNKLVPSLAALVILIITSSSLAQDKNVINLYKAASIYKFTNYIEIEGHSGNVKVCVVGDDKVFKLLEKIIEKRKRPDQKLKPIYFSKYDKNLSECNYLYISNKVSKDLKNIIDLVVEKPIITISDTANFTLNNRGLIEIFEDSGRVKFKINLRKSIEKGINISSKLIESAEEVN